VDGILELGHLSPVTKVKVVDAREPVELRLRLWIESGTKVKVE
jgi:hypothetical protein